MSNLVLLSPTRHTPRAPTAARRANSPATTPRLPQCQQEDGARSGRLKCRTSRLGQAHVSTCGSWPHSGRRNIGVNWILEHERSTLSFFPHECTGVGAGSKGGFACATGGEVQPSGVLSFAAGSVNIVYSSGDLREFCHIMLRARSKGKGSIRDRLQNGTERRGDRLGIIYIHRSRCILNGQRWSSVALLLYRTKFRYTVTAIR